LNRWLADQGWLTYKSVDGRDKLNWKNQVLSWLIRQYRKSVPSEVRTRIRGRLGTQHFDLVKGTVESALFSSTIDWYKTRAYSLGAGGNIFINLNGREPYGVVQPGRDYEDAVQSLRAQLINLTDPDTGENIIKKVWRQHDLYNGPFQHQAPDLILEWADYKYWGRGRYDVQNVPIFEDWFKMDFSDLVLSGTHRRHGVLIVSGPGARDGMVLQNTSILDITPTVLAYLNLPVPEDMDGHFLETAFIPNYVNVYFVSHRGMQPAEQSFSEQESADISERLQKLGYL
ncbi:MAG: hypothetical protein P1S60_20115, partial [Anaerolineae bacterium]|nr:hypothetical protein [Anaerolineae bacterium]